MERNFLYFSDSLDGWQNLAQDEWFLDHIGADDLVLYFYVNENAVIIGKNQNPWKECNLDAMERDRVQLVRRISGGGAVYHDAGNLNFSFICGEGRYDLERNLSLILEAVRAMGIPCEFSGRNDLLADGRKFSGNAFSTRKGIKLHHGTLLISSDLKRLENYLTVDPRKIRSKGIDSVRSRVCNLSSFSKDLTVETMREAVASSFRKNFANVQEWHFSKEEWEEVLTYAEKHASWEWRLGTTPKFDIAFDERFSFGGVQLLFSLEKGVISSLDVFSDANDASLPERIETALKGVHFDSEAIYCALLQTGDEKIGEVAEFLKEQKL